MTPEETKTFESEKEWLKRASECYPIVDARKVLCHDNQGQLTRQDAYILGIDDFKSALRKEIENERQQASLSGSSVTFKQGYVEALTYTLDLLDSVTPPKQ